MEIQPHALTWKPLCSIALFCLAIGKFLRFSSRKLLSITLLLPEGVLPPPAAKVRISERNTKEKVNFFFLFPSASTFGKAKGNKNIWNGQKERREIFRWSEISRRYRFARLFVKICLASSPSA